MSSTTTTAMAAQFTRRALAELQQPILSHFSAPIRFCLAYGSAVFPQRQTNSNTAAAKDNMVDLIFGVTHAEHWHSLNLRQNPHHYSPLMRRLGAGAVDRVQRQFIGAPIYYNTYVRVPGVSRPLKYGVVAIDDLLNDLEQWPTMYIAGRMQKPTLILRGDARVELAQRRNLSGALAASLLMMPRSAAPRRPLSSSPTFTDEQLFLKVASLSYMGDVRMLVRGEDPHKVYNIVYKQLPQFKQLYDPVIDDVPGVDYVREGKLQFDDSPKAITALLRQLPKTVQMRLIQRYGGSPYMLGGGGEWDTIAQSPDLHTNVARVVRDITLWPSITQSLKGVLTAGLLPSLKYVTRKFGKGLSASK